MDVWAIDEFDCYDDDALNEEGVVCKYCGEPFLTWQGSPYGWRLFNEKGEMHSCLGGPQPPADAHDFPLLSDGE